MTTIVVTTSITSTVSIADLKPVFSEHTLDINNIFKNLSQSDFAKFDINEDYFQKFQEAEKSIAPIIAKVRDAYNNKKNNIELLHNEFNELLKYMVQRRDFGGTLHILSIAALTSANEKLQKAEHRCQFVPGQHNITNAVTCNDPVKIPGSLWCQNHTCPGIPDIGRICNMWKFSDCHICTACRKYIKSNV